MSKRALVPVNVLASEAEPSGQYAGDLYYNETDTSVFVYTGSAWNAVGGGDIDGGNPTSIYLTEDTLDGGTP